MTAEMHGNPC